MLSFLYSPTLTSICDYWKKWVVGAPYIFWMLLTPYQICGLQIYSLFHVSCPLCWYFPLLCRSFWVYNIVWFIHSLFSCLCFWCNCLDQCHEAFPLVSSGSFIVLDLMFKPLTHLSQYLCKIKDQISKNIQMANKYMKRCTASLIIIKMQTNNEILLHTCQDDHYYKKETNNNNKKNKYCQGCGEIGVLIYC